MHFSLTAILVSRFMLDLHEAHAALAHKCSDLSTIQIMSLNIPQPYSSESEDLEDWAVASNLTSSHTEPESGSETEVSVFMQLAAQNAVRWMSLIL